MKNTVVIGTNYNSWERGQTQPCRLRISHSARAVLGRGAHQGGSVWCGWGLLLYPLPTSAEPVLVAVGSAALGMGEIFSEIKI